MSMPYAASSEAHHGAPKRSNSGREIVYVFPQSGAGASAADPSSSQIEPIPADVHRALELLRNYSFRDVYRWLKLDRQDEINRSSIALNRPQQVVNGHGHAPQHTPRMSVASSAHGSSRASSIFSAGAKRISVASTNTQYSHISDPGQQPAINPNWEATLPVNGSRHASIQTAQVVNLNRQNSVAMISSPNAKHARPAIIQQTTPRPTPRQRESDVEAKKKYFCTACNKGFARKYDWKVHEQRYHEQQTQYPCPDCNQILFAETLFKSHHRDAHGCQDCPHAKAIAKDVDVRRKRTAWGCGFCGEFLDDWEKRCDHVAAHYDSGTKREEWDHSKVIVGLLRQPEIDPEWRQLLLNRHGQYPNDLGLRFSKEATGRSHGENAAQLQDLLEFGACPRDISTMVQLAYEQGYRRPASVVPSSQPSGPASSLMSPPYTISQDAIMESPVQQATQESPVQFVTPTSNSSPMDAFGEMNINAAAMGAYQTPAESRMSSVGPTVSATLTGPLDWSTYQMYPDHFAMQQPMQQPLPVQQPMPVQQQMSVPQQNSNRMSISYDKPLPSIPPELDMHSGRDSATPRPHQDRPPHIANVADQFLPVQDFNTDSWSLVSSTLVDDPNAVNHFFTHEQHFV